MNSAARATSETTKWARLGALRPENNHRNIELIRIMYNTYIILKAEDVEYE